VFGTMVFYLNYNNVVLMVLFCRGLNTI